MLCGSRSLTLLNIAKQCFLDFGTLRQLIWYSKEVFFLSQPYVYIITQIFRNVKFLVQYNNLQNLPYRIQE